MKVASPQLYQQFGLGFGLAVPFLYFCSQIAAEPFYVDYDRTQQLASELGSLQNVGSTLFNGGMALTGFATLIAAVAYFDALKRTAPAFLTAACLISSGAATLWAAFHPLPSPIHNPGFWGIGTLLFPLALCSALRRFPNTLAARAYLLLSFFSGICALLLSELQLAPPGSMQRVAAVMVYSPVAVGAWLLWTKGQETKKAANGLRVAP